MGRLDNLGAALRHLRLHGGPAPRKQLEIADRAGVTRGMLSSYERGRQSPSVENLDRVLGALGADLADLQWALEIVNAPTGGTHRRDPGAPYPPPAADPSLVREEPPAYRTVSVPEPLDEDEEEALGQMVSGFLAWLRYTRRLQAEREESGETPDEGDRSPPTP